MYVQARRVRRGPGGGTVRAKGYRPRLKWFECDCCHENHVPREGDLCRECYEGVMDALEWSLESLLEEEKPIAPSAGGGA